MTLYEFHDVALIILIMEEVFHVVYVNSSVLTVLGIQCLCKIPTLVANCTSVVL